MATNEKVPLLVARMRALLNRLDEVLEDPKARYFRPGPALELFHTVEGLRLEARLRAPLAFGDMIERETPRSSGTSDFDGEGYIERLVLVQARADLKYCLDVLEGMQAPAPRSEEKTPPQSEPTMTPRDVAEVSLGEVFRRYPVGKLVAVTTAVLVAGLTVGWAAGRWTAGIEGSAEVRQLRAEAATALQERTALRRALEACRQGSPPSPP